MATNAAATLISEQIVKLPLIDRSVAELLTVLNKPISNFNQIITYLSPEVAARFLDMANSASPDREVSSISYAVQLLGYDHMKKILVSSILMDQFTRHLPAFDFKRFQTQSLFCAVLSRIVGKIIDYEKPEDLFTAGLMHNIGKQIIAVHFEEAHQRIVSLKNETGIETGEAERHVLGMTHAEIGSMVLKKFNIPDRICEAVRYHNVSLDRLPPYPEGELCRIIHTTSRIVSHYSLPETFPTISLERQLQTDIDILQEKHKVAVGEAVRTVGYHKAYPRLLEKVSDGLMIDLRKQLRMRKEFVHLECADRSG